MIIRKLGLAQAAGSGGNNSNGGAGGYAVGVSAASGTTSGYETAIDSNATGIADGTPES